MSAPVFRTAVSRLLVPHVLQASASPGATLPDWGQAGAWSLSPALVLPPLPHQLDAESPSRVASEHMTQLLQVVRDWGRGLVGRRGGVGLVLYPSCCILLSQHCIRWHTEGIVLWCSCFASARWLVTPACML